MVKDRTDESESWRYRHGLKLAAVHSVAWALVLLAAALFEPDNFVFFSISAACVVSICSMTFWLIRGLTK